ncbi:MAG: GMC family oxidoreductase N-terminal domain-containing protein [Afipia sp.]|nr:GMC family oxidoreductase N-terminal domain-containing protein [Afipia sp.]
MTEAQGETFDYVIVGGGTAGCVLANRLTASGRHSVLLLEAGGEARSMWIPIPAGFSKLLTNPAYNWRFQSEPEEATHNRAISVPRGKGAWRLYSHQRHDLCAWPAAGLRRMGAARLLGLGLR